LIYVLNENIMMKKNLLLLIITFSLFSVQVYSQNHNLKSFPKEASPEVIGLRVVEKFLKTPHSLYGNTHPTTFTSLQIHYRKTKKNTG